MAFGSFDAVSSNKKRKKTGIPEPTERIKKPIPTDVVKPPVITGGGGGKLPPPPPPVVVDGKGAVMQIRIAVAGRSIAEILDYIAGLHTNMNNLVGNAGLAFFSEAGAQLGELLERQKAISGIFTDPEMTEYRVADGLENGDGAPKAVSWTLSKAGVQSFRFQISFDCVTYAQLLGDRLPACDMLWVFGDALLYAQNAPSAPGGSDALALIARGKEANLPVSLIAGHVEQFGRIRERDSVCSVDGDVCKKVREALGGGDDTAFIPVQVYGGLTFKTVEGDGCLVFEENKFGGMREYKPEGCHIPLLIAMEQVNAGADSAGNEILEAIRKLNRVQRTEYASAGLDI